jgi:hypothetical protein
LNYYIDEIVYDEEGKSLDEFFDRIKEYDIKDIINF